MPGYHLGKKPARPDAVQLRFGAYFKSENLPAPPMVIGKPWLVRTWGMLGNDQYGDCVWAGGDHETMMLCALAGKSMPLFTSANALADYAACTGFNPNNPNSDQGTDVQEAAAYRQNTGLIDATGNRHKLDIYTALRVADLTELALAVFMFGVAGIGVQLPDTAESQFDQMEVWDVKAGAQNAGGHYIPCIGRNSQGNFLFVSWGRLQAATPAWVRTYMDEGLCFISRDYDSPALLSDFKQVTS